MSNDTLHPFDDDLSDLIGSPMKVLPAAVHPHADPAQVRVFNEPCPACNGSGTWRSYAGNGFRCFKCKGTGKRAFKSSPEVRAKSKMAAVARKAKTVEENFDYFSKQHPEIWAWFEASKNFEFAVSLKAGVAKWGSLTEKQLAAAYRCSEKFNAARARIAGRKANAPELKVDALRQAFDKAASKGLKSPKLRLGSFFFNRNPHFAGDIGIYDEHRKFIGKVPAGTNAFVAQWRVTDETIAQLQKVVSDPAAAAIAYGNRTGNCACCGKLLTVKKSVDRGIGPICYDRYF
jgi:hypothetical protein